MTGIDTWILASERSAAVLSQLLLVTGCLLAVRLVLTMARQPQLNLLFRIAKASLAAVTVTVVIAAGRGPISPHWALGLGLLTAVLAAVTAPRLLLAPQTRLIGLVLALGAGTASLQVLARVVVLVAHGELLPMVFIAARGVTTIALVLDIVTLTVVGVWLALRCWRRALLATGAVAVISGFITWGALHGSDYDASFWKILAARALGELTRHPMPLVPLSLRYLIEVAMLGAVAAVLFGRRRGHAVYAAVAFTLLARGATDIPVLALVLTLAALVATLTSVTVDATWVRADHGATKADGGAEAPAAPPRGGA
jgi:hypothetical protein